MTRQRMLRNALVLVTLAAANWPNDAAAQLDSVLRDLMGRIQAPQTPSYPPAIFLSTPGIPATLATLAAGAAKAAPAHRRPAPRH
jgi:hypothetical protein